MTDPLKEELPEWTRRMIAGVGVAVATLFVTRYLDEESVPIKVIIALSLMFSIHQLLVSTSLFIKRKLRGNHGPGD